MESTTSVDDSEASSAVDSSKTTHMAEQEPNGRPARMVDGVMRWITEDGTPGDIVSNGNFYFTQFHDGTFRLFNKKYRTERTAEFSIPSSAGYNPLSKESMIP